jgi:pSer/pThr/pTyr-binding forkhead associated (FHA) protein
MLEDQFGKLIVTLPDQLVQEFDLGKSSIEIGRAMHNDIILNDVRVSRLHARLEFTPTGCHLTDLGSSNGTYLNGKPVNEALLKPGDLITMGSSTLRYESQQPISDPGMTVIDDLSDLEMTMAQISLPVNVNETGGPRLVVHTAEKIWEIPLDEYDSLRIGRSAENEIVLDLPKISRTHVVIFRRGNTFIIQDQNSTNGTWLGDQRIQEQALEDGQSLRIGDARLIFKNGFSGESLTMADLSPLELRQRLPVVFVPGLMGSQLWRGSECVWPNLKVLFTNPEIYAYPGDIPLKPRGILEQVVIVPNLVKLDQYNRLGDYLVEDLGYTRGADFFEFAYDWRQDVRLSARQLSQAIQDWKIQPPFILIAHSLGTLVSRYYVERLGGKQLVERLILMGGPHIGTPAGLTSLTIGPNLLPFGLMGERLRRVVASFPSAYQIIPEYACGTDQQGNKINFLQNESWVQPEQLPLLRAAREFRRELGKQPSVPCVSIFGYGLKTVANVNIQTGPDGGLKNVMYIAEPSGDDSVPQHSAFLPGSEIHPVKQHHGALFVDSDVKMRLKLELLGRHS